MSDKPNVIIMYADDLGYGDISYYGANGIPTPNTDQLARESLVFKQAYATAATCTPSRFSLLTGSYPWRNKKAEILPGDAPLIIPEDTFTLPRLFKINGYVTGIVGKWHLGLGKGDLNWNKAISATPIDIGFDFSFIMPATNDRVPCVYIEGRNVVGLEAKDPIEVSYDYKNPFPDVPTARTHPELLKLKPSHGHDMTIINGISRIGYMRGGKKALWKDEDMAKTFLNKAIEFIEKNRDRPFFLYYAFHQPHVPRVSSPEFAGSSKRGARGDVIVELDWCVGKILEKIDELKLKGNTIIIFSSDNGPVLDDGYMDNAVKLSVGHKPAGPLRGGKYSLYDGGVRVPFMIRWPGKIKAGISNALICQVDLLRSFSQLLGTELPAGYAPDSIQLIDVLLGYTEKGRKELVTEGIGARTVLRVEEWVYLPPYPGPAVFPETGIESGFSPEPQLYNLSADIGQRKNLASEIKSKVKEMEERLKEIKNL